jgi:hypothetical protein
MDVFIYSFGTESCYITQAGPEFMILLSLPPECWNYSCASPCLLIPITKKQKQQQQKHYCLKVCNPVTFSTFTVSCNHQHYLIPEYSHHPDKTLWFPWSTVCIPVLPGPANHNLLPVFMDLLNLEISYKGLTQMWCFTSESFHKA